MDPRPTSDQTSGPASPVPRVPAAEGAPAAHAAPRSEFFGLALAFLSAGLYAVGTVCAALTYDAGARPSTIVWLRFLFAAVALALLSRAMGRPLRVARRHWRGLLGTALGLLGITNGYLTSVAYIPIELAVLIFYTFPLLVGTAEALMEGRRIGLFAVLCYLLAFGGLALSLGPSFADLDWRGIALASLASASSVLALLASRAVAREAEPLAVACLANVFGFAAMSVFVPFATGIALPSGLYGWSTMTIACTVFIGAFALQIVSVRFAGAGPVAMMYNFEPALTVLIAWTFLGAMFEVTEALGVALILIALFAAPRAWRRRFRTRLDPA